MEGLQSGRPWPGLRRSPCALARGVEAQPREGRQEESSAVGGTMKVIYLLEGLIGAPDYISHLESYNEARERPAVRLFRIQTLRCTTRPRISKHA